MLSVTEVRDALAAAISDGCGLRAEALWPAGDKAIASPLAVVTRRAFDPRLVFSDRKAVYLFTVTVYADRASERSAQKLLDGYCELAGTGSVRAAIEDGDNWSVTVDYAEVTQIGEVGAVSINEADYLAVPFDVEVCW